MFFATTDQKMHIAIPKLDEGNKLRCLLITLSLSLSVYLPTYLPTCLTAYLPTHLLVKVPAMFRYKMKPSILDQITPPFIVR